MSVVALGMLALLLLACNPPPEAPSELDALVGYLYAHALDEDPEALQVGATALDAWMDARLEETLDGYAVNVLDEATVDALDGTDRSAEGLVGAAVGYASPNDPWTLVASVLTSDPLARPDTTSLAYERDEDLESRACFLDGACGSHVFESRGTDSLPLGLEVTSHVAQQYRWFELPDGRRASVQRTWLKSPAEVNYDWLEVLGQYYLWIALPHEDGTRNMFATWALTRLTGNDVPEDLALSLAVDQMRSGGEGLDAWIAENPPAR